MIRFWRYLLSPSPMGLLRRYILVVALAAAIVVITFLNAAARIDSDGRESAAQANIALRATQVQADLAAPILVLSDGFVSFFQSERFRSLPPEVQDASRARVFDRAVRRATGEDPDLTMQVSDRSLVEFQRLFEFVLGQIDGLLAEGAGIEALDAVAARRLEASRRFDAYLEDESFAGYAMLFGSLLDLSEDLKHAAAGLSLRVAAGQAALEESTSDGRIAMVLALSLLVSAMAAATVAMGRQIQHAFAVANEEREALRSATATLQYRNQQLNALYSVFGEVTDTLSLHYVVDATIREAMRLVNAGVVVLRLLKESQLVAVGSLAAEGMVMPELAPLTLGEGTVGRAAKRGRTLLINGNNLDVIAKLQRQNGIRSGLVVPLIVGARVVGVLSCWSTRDDAFDEEDQRILELMASQVATAVVAADATEASERRAHHDALTGLPNRLQLTKDLAGELANLAAEGRKAVIAMVDIDHFKRFNDDYGHRVGDVTLQKVASLLATSVREQDKVYRYGGEEFVLVFPDTGADDGFALAERVRSGVATSPYSGDRLEPVGPVHISIGLAVLPDHGSDLAQLLELADSAMYEAKETGRNRVVLWHGQRSLPAPAA